MRLQSLEEEAGSGEFWSDRERAQEVLRERSQVSSQIEAFNKLSYAAEECEVLLELLDESADADLLDEAAGKISLLCQDISRFELARMLSGEHDSNDAIVEINSGAGGTEAQDWCEMLLRMYLRWAEKKGFKTEIVSIHAGEEAGLKNVAFLVSGQNAYGFLRSERGVHRLVRISPFDSNARRHTSFASVGVTPDIELSADVEIRDEDLRIDTYRASGAGGQHVNKTDSAVRITHLPSGVVVACQNERSQHKNKATAMRLLRAKLYELELQKNQEKLSKIAGERRKIDFGSQIRSYVMQPYQLVKDLRTDTEIGNVQAVLDGEIDKFIEAYLLWQSQ